MPFLRDYRVSEAAHEHAEFEQLLLECDGQRFVTDHDRAYRCQAFEHGHAQLSDFLAEVLGVVAQKARGCQDALADFDEIVANGFQSDVVGLV